MHRRLEALAKTVAGGSLLIALEGCSGSVAAPTDIKPINTPFPTATSVDNPIAELTRAAQAPRPIETPIPTAAIVFQPTPESSVIAFSSKAPTVIASAKPLTPSKEAQIPNDWKIYRSSTNPIEFSYPASFDVSTALFTRLRSSQKNAKGFASNITVRSDSKILPFATAEDVRDDYLTEIKERVASRTNTRPMPDIKSTPVNVGSIKGYMITTIIPDGTVLYFGPGEFTNTSQVADISLAGVIFPAAGLSWVIELATDPSEMQKAQSDYFLKMLGSVKIRT